MKFVQINRDVIANADYIAKIEIDKPKKGNVTIIMAAGSYYDNRIVLSWLEWTDLKPKLGLGEIKDGKVIDVWPMISTDTFK